MKKSLYYTIEIIVTIIYSFLWHYITLNNAPMGWDSGSGDGSFGLMFWMGIIIYCIMLAILMIFGKKRIENWKWYDFIITLVIAAICMVAGLYIMVHIFI